LVRVPVVVLARVCTTLGAYANATLVYNNST